MLEQIKEMLIKKQALAGSGINKVRMLKDNLVWEVKGQYVIGMYEEDEVLKVRFRTYDMLEESVYLYLKTTDDPDYVIQETMRFILNTRQDFEHAYRAVEEIKVIKAVGRHKKVLAKLIDKLTKEDK